MGTTNKRSTDLQFFGLRWLLSRVRCAILHIVGASRGPDEEECSKVLERTICGALSVNVCVPEKNRISTHETRQCGSLYSSKQLKDHEKNYPTHDLEFAALLYAMDIYGRIISMAGSVKFIPTIRVSGKYSRESVRT